MDEEVVTLLYGLPLDEFVAARNQLAKERKDPAIKKLRKPSVAAWAVDQLARRFADAMDDVVDAADALRKAQRRALSGGSGAALRDATRAHRDAVDALVARVADVLPDASAATTERVRTTVTAASLDEELVDRLQAGTLDEEVEPAGFGDVTGLELLLSAEPEGEPSALAEQEAEEPDEPAPDPRAEERAAAAAELDDARRRRDEAEAALRDAEREVRRAEQRLTEIG